MVELCYLLKNKEVMHFGRRKRKTAQSHWSREFALLKSYVAHLNLMSMCAQNRGGGVTRLSAVTRLLAKTQLII